MSATAERTRAAPAAQPRETSERLAAVLAHELRNPLGAAMAGLGAVAELTEATDPRRPFVERALADLARLGELLDRCLELGRTGAPRRRRVDLAELAHGLAARHERVAVTAPAAVPVEGDDRLLERALENLIENARAAGAGSVTLAVAAGPRTATVDVADDGPGVPAELRPRLFEPFVSGRGGSGLGLHVVQRVARGHGGDVELLPSPRGARFRLSLPRHSAPSRR